MRSLKPIYEEILSYAVMLRTDNTDKGLLQGFNKLVSYVATKESYKGVHTEVFKIVEFELLKTFDIDLLKSEVRDWFTETIEYANLIPVFHKVRYNKILKETEEVYNQLGKVAPTILITDKQSQRLMVKLYKRLGKNVIYNVVVSDIMFYHIALLNAHLYNIPAMILHADPNVHTIELQSPNWNTANVWDPAITTKGLEL